MSVAKAELGREEGVVLCHAGSYIGKRVLLGIHEF